MSGSATALAALATALSLTGSVASNAHGSGPTPSANGRIAYVAVGGIGSMNPDGSGQWGIELDVGDHDPAWSPDGTQLAVVTTWAGRFGILVMQPDGSGAHLVAVASIRPGRPTAPSSPSTPPRRSG
jgi:WD40-like Beta Propeller Repeat